MAGALKINPGTKLRIAFDVPIGQEPKFNMICTFNKALDESAFLVSIPMVGGKALEPDDNQKLLFKYGDGEDLGIVAGYVDDVVKIRNPSLLESPPCNGASTVYKTCGYPYEGGFTNPVYAGYLGIKFRW